MYIGKITIKMHTYNRINLFNRGISNNTECLSENNKKGNSRKLMNSIPRNQGDSLIQTLDCIFYIPPSGPNFLFMLSSCKKWMGRSLKR